MKKLFRVFLSMLMVISVINPNTLLALTSTPIYSKTDLVTINNGQNALDISDKVSELSDDLTFNTTFTCTGTSVNSLIFIGDSTTQNNYFTAYINGSKLGLEHRNASGGQLLSSATVDIPSYDLTQEHKLTVTYEGGVKYQIYLDGRMIKEGTTSSNIVSGSIANADYMGIGIGKRNNATSNYPFTGTHRNVEVYNTVLTEEEIQYYHSNERKDLLLSANDLYFGDNAKYESLSDVNAVNALKQLTKGTISIVYRVEEVTDEKMTLVGFSNKDSNNEYFNIYVNPQANTVGVEYNGTDLPIVNAGVNNTSWHTLTITKTDSSSNNRYTFYVDGRKLNYYSNREGFLNQFTNANVISGGYSDLSTDTGFFKGGINSVSIYTEVATDNEVADLHSKLVYDAPMVDDLSNASISEKTELFYSGYDGSVGYRIPSMILTKDGTIIAATDQRNSGLGDAGNIDFILRRKEANDADFGEPIEVIDLVDNNNQTPCAFVIDAAMVQDQKTGRIFAFVDMFPESSGLMNTGILSTGNGYETINGKQYQKLFDANNNEYTVRENGVVYDSDGNVTEYVMITECEAPYKELGNLYKNGEYAGNAYIFSGVKNGELHILRAQYLWMTYSDDDGKTWSCPKDISSQVKEDWMMFIGTGPGCGIQLDNGNLVVPVYTANSNVGASQASAVIISKDGGETWTLGESPVKLEGNDRATMTSGRILTESQVIQMNNGDLKIFMRNGSGKVLMATSKDGGETWQNLETLSVPNVYCQLSVIHYTVDGQERILLVNPVTGGRYNISVFLGTVQEDGSMTWVSKLLDSGHTQYSSTIHLGTDEHGDEKFAVLYEADARGAMSQIYVEFDENWVKTAEVEKTQTNPELLNLNVTKQDNELLLELEFDQAVMAVGEPKLTLNQGTASYVSGSSTNTLTFKVVLTGNEAGTLKITGINTEKGYLESVINDEVIVSGDLYVFNTIDNVSIESYSSQHSSSTAENSDGAAVNAIDGNPNTYWHSTWGNNSITLPQHLIIDLESVKEIYRIDYLGRQNSQSGRVINYEISVSTDGNTYKTVKTGTLQNSAALQSIEFAPVNARYVKFNVLTSSVAGSCAIAELNFYTYSADLAMQTNKTALQALYNSVKGIDVSVYSDATKEAFENALETAKTLLSSSTTQGLVDDAYNTLLAAKKGLVSVSKLKEYEETLSSYKESKYTPESWQAYLEAKADLTEVSKDATDSKDITDAIMKTNYALTLLEEKEIIEVNKDELLAKYEELDGTEQGNYTDDSYKAFTDALVAAKLMLDNDEATQEEVDACVQALTEAFAGLKEKEEEPEKPLPFEDVSEKQWYHTWVKEAYSLGLMTGATETLFKPNSNMNRGMVAIVFHRMEGSQVVEYSKVFPDVANNQYYTTSVLWAKANGVINGYTDGTFKPLKNVTREEMVTMIYNFAKYKGLDVNSEHNIKYFNDYAKITQYAKAPLRWAVENELISGKDNGTRLDPLGTATRAECCKMLVQAYKVIYK